jgi:DNA-binding HxlR family transcriptional regulator
MTTRSYNQFCALASALDYVGEHWTLLIIRELLIGPGRFKDLMDGMQGISTNLLLERLKSLEQQGILRQHVLPPPAGSTVYELTPLGQSLEKPILELGKWGAQLLPRSSEGIALPSLGSIAVALKAFFHPERTQNINETYALHLGEETLQVLVNEGEIKVQQCEPPNSDVDFYTDMQIFLGLFTGQLKPEEAIEQDLIRIEADPGALRRFLSYCYVPGPPN